MSTEEPAPISRGAAFLRLIGSGRSFAVVARLGTGDRAEGAALLQPAAFDPDVVGSGMTSIGRHHAAFAAAIAG